MDQALREEVLKFDPEIITAGLPSSEDEGPFFDKGPSLDQMESDLYMSPEDIARRGKTIRNWLLVAIAVGAAYWWSKHDVASD